MPTMLIDEPLGLTCVFSDGSRSDYSLHGLPNPQLARDLALGLVGLIHPHGTVDAEGTVNFYIQSLRSMVRTLAAQGFAGGAGQLRRGQLAGFWMSSPSRLEAMTRSLLEGYAQSGGTLGDGVLDLAAGRHFNIQPNRQPLPPYPEEEWQRLTRICRTLVDDSYDAHRRALADAASGQHPLKAAGSRAICAGCWPGSGPSASASSAGTWGSRRRWCTSAAASTTRPGPSSLTWTC